MFSGTSTLPSAVLLGDLSFTDGNELLLLFILTSASNLRLLHPAQLGFLKFWRGKVTWDEHNNILLLTHGSHLWF